MDYFADIGMYAAIATYTAIALWTVLARLGGRPVAILANQPAVRAGAIDVPAAEKAAHFLELADAFHLPVIFLADNPGIMAGSRAERAGTLRAAARMYAAQARVRTPKLHVTLRKAFGFGSVVMAHNPFDRQTLSISLPGVTMAAMPASSGGPTAKLSAEEQAEAEAAQASGPYKMAHGLGYDDIIDPCELRDKILDGLSIVETG